MRQFGLALVALAVGCGEEDPSVWADEYTPEGASLEEADLEETFGGDYRVRGALYYLSLVLEDRIEAHAYDYHVPDDYDDGTMIYSTTINQAMIDQLNDVSAVGGTNEVVFTLREGLSLSGAGTGSFTGNIVVNVGGQTIGTVYDFGSTHGSSNATYRFAITSNHIAQLSPGGTLEVVATGNGEAHSNGSPLVNQAIVTWYFTSGLPYVRSVP
jgi:hypothetical protein